jgi:hypothetical protein
MTRGVADHPLADAMNPTRSGPDLSKRDDFAVVSGPHLTFASGGGDAAEGIDYEQYEVVGWIHPSRDGGNKRRVRRRRRHA